MSETLKASRKRDRKAARGNVAKDDEGMLDEAEDAMLDEEDEEEDEEDENEEDDDEMDDAAAMRLDNVMEEEGVEEVAFDFDDPQDKHYASIVGLLRRSPTLALTGGSTTACDALADVVARDPASVGTVVEAGEDVVCCAAVIQLQHYTDGHAGVDAARAALASASATAREAADLERAASVDAGACIKAALVVRGRMVNVPPRVIAAAYRCLLDDVKDLGFQAFVLVARGTPPPDGGAVTSSSSSPLGGGGGGGGKPGGGGRAKKKKASPLVNGLDLDCDDFDDELFAAKASICVPLESSSETSSSSTGQTARVFALYLTADAFRTAVAEIHRLAEL